MIRSLLAIVILLFFVNHTYAAQEEAVLDSTNANSQLTFSMKSDSSKDTPNLKSIILVFFALIVLAFVFIVLIKKFVFSSQTIFQDSSTINIVASKRVSVKTIIHFIEIEGTKYVLADRDNALAIVKHKNETEQDAKS